MKTHAETFDTSEFRAASLIEERRQEEIALPSDWTAYFIRRLGSLRAREAARRKGFQEDASARHSNVACELK